MPIEIKELHIKATVNGNTQNASGSSSDTDCCEEAKQEVIATCVEKVMEIMKDKLER